MKFLSALLIASFLACASTTNAAEPSKESEREQQQIAALSKELEGQQAAILENQTKINEKIAAIAEALRQAKIYAGRGR
jgi:ABC-type transporter MlaC component